MNTRITEPVIKSELTKVKISTLHIFTAFKNSQLLICEWTLKIDCPQFLNDSLLALSESHYEI